MARSIKKGFFVDYHLLDTRKTGLPGGTGPTVSSLALGNCMNCHSQVHGSNHPSGSSLTR